MNDLKIQDVENYLQEEQENIFPQVKDEEVELLLMRHLMLAFDALENYI